MKPAIVFAFATGLVPAVLIAAASAEPDVAPMQKIDAFAIDRTEVTVGAFARYVAATGFVTKAEREGGSFVYEAGWAKKSGWSWRRPFGMVAGLKEPAVHVTFAEAKAYCAWAGKRLPTDREWMTAAYTEMRANAPAPFTRGKIYPYPTGNSPNGANCLGECGPAPAIDYSSVLTRGKGHAPAGSTKLGVNGLYDMGANVWEWVDTGGGGEKITRGGSWWYGAAQMRASYQASKPSDMAVVYIGFRCARDLP